jgi:hypothetical protein
MEKAGPVERTGTTRRTGSDTAVLRIFGLVLLGLMLAGDLLAVEVFIPQISARPGEMVQVPVVVDQAEGLAGVKLVLTYEPDVLQFKEAAKGPKAQAMMHIVNDRKPGHLILVMAGARGIDGKNLVLFHLGFQVQKSMKNGRESTRVQIVETQLLSEQLREIKATVKTGVIRLE